MHSHQGETRERPPRARATHALPAGGHAARYLALQRQAGNAAVTGLLDPHRTVQRDPKDKTPAKAGKTPDWMAPSFTDPLPGVPVTGFDSPGHLRPWMPVQVPMMGGPAHLYTEPDREALREGLIARQKENVGSVGRFINDYIVAVVNITGQYVAAEMRDAANAPERGTFIKLMKFALGETAEALLAGGVGVFAVKLLAKGTVKALEFLSEKGTGYAWNEISGMDDKALRDESLDTRQTFLNKVSAQAAVGAGQFAEGMIHSLGEGEEVNRAYWLAKAKLLDLWRFRVPEVFPAANPQALQQVVAGVIAGSASTGAERTKYDCWGLQCAGDTYHRHEIIVHVTPTDSGGRVTSAQLNSSSAVLSTALKGAPIRMLPNMPLYIVVEPVTALDSSVKLMDAVRAPGSATIEEIGEFNAAYPTGEAGPMVIRRDGGHVTVAGGGLAAAVWYYRMATGDHSLTGLATEIRSMQEAAQQDEDNDEGVSNLTRPDRLAKLAHWRLNAQRGIGAAKLINGYVLDAVPQPATGKFTKGRSLEKSATTSIDYE